MAQKRYGLLLVPGQESRSNLIGTVTNVHLRRWTLVPVQKVANGCAEFGWDVLDDLLRKTETSSADRNKELTVNEWVVCPALWSSLDAV